MPDKKRCHDFDAYVVAHQRAYFWADKSSPLPQRRQIRAGKGGRGKE